MKVYMAPEPAKVANQTPSGIQTTINKYAEFASYYKIEFVSDPADADVAAIHAGTPLILEAPLPIVAHCHGLYWTGDNKSDPWEYRMNREVINVIRRADVVTVPSQWVAQAFRRDMHLDPVVLPHGVVPTEWKSKPGEIPYILWNKNRASDACDPTPVQYLSEKFPDNYFLSTFAKNPKTVRKNLRLTGTVPHSEMKEMVQAAHIYLATTKETFGIGTLEALASGVPVLGFDWGGTSDIVQHGINGYLAKPGDLADLEEGLRYCLEHHRILSANAFLRAKEFKWNGAMRQLKAAYELAIERFHKPHDVSVVIPCFNKRETIARAVRSASQQTLKPNNIIVVNNNSTDGSDAEASSLEAEVTALGINYIVTNCPTQGVAHARNWGCGLTDTRYICCLDGDDSIDPPFLEVCVDTLRQDQSLGLAYTKLVYMDGEKENPQRWPGEYDFDKFLIRQNQVPTCCVFRHDLWERLGGFRQRYAPDGAGAEDAEFWLRIGASGYRGKLASDFHLFRYHSGGQTQLNPTYKEEDWLAWHPWVKDRQHPFASPATPANGLPSHPVRSYDQPVVSVIIPCSRHHMRYLIDAIDSLEAQTLRQWEAVVFLDFLPEEGEKESLLTMYPYIKLAHVDDMPLGAGFARNVGARIATAPLLVFLDADDWLEPECLASLVAVYKLTGEFPYSDYYGHVKMPKSQAESGLQVNRLKSYNEKREEAVTLHYALDYNCQRAQEQPKKDEKDRFYIWNIVTTLTTKEAHNAIGGFDEKMLSYEDWDYWLRMARNGYCFTHIPEHLVNYRFNSGSRRDTGRQNHETLIDYLLAKYQGEKVMPCRGCKGGRSKVPANTANASSPYSMTQRNVALAGGQERFTMSADTMVDVKLIDGNEGEHPIIIRDQTTQKSHNYGYRRNGEVFLMSKKHAEMYPSKFQILEVKKPESVAVAATNKVVTPPPPNLNTKISQESIKAAVAEEPAPSGDPNWQDWGMTELQSKKLMEAGITTSAKLSAIGVNGLHDLTGMSLNMAKGYVEKAKAGS